ncbi:MAG: peptidase T [Candidatus Coproplasma sp.]
MERVEDKFLRYVQVDTPSDEDNFDNTPSTDCQRNLATMLAGELEALGLKAEVTEHGYVYSAIEGNCESKYAIGLIAHLDVVSHPKGYGVKPQVADGVITSDGTTILGADDKAGVAEIMALAEYLVNNPQIKHGKVGIAFTPDEEIGHGAKLFDVERFGCDFAYTVDGEELGEISYETFNGACFDLEITGRNIHPGQAKGVMVNAIVLANEFINLLPCDQRPETTEGREGYYFITDIAGGVESCTVHGIIREHDRAKFEGRKAFVQEVVDKLNKKYDGRISLKMRDQYYNCAEVITPHMHLVENAVAAMEEVGVEPKIFPIRGGTDGSSLSFMGLPCPNICTGGLNAHGLDERIAIEDMHKVVQILLGIVKRYAV